MKTLRDVSIGQTVKVVKLHGEGPIKRRIMDMGITKGVREMPRLVRMKSLQPRSCSRLFMQRVILGWLLPNTSAARVKLLCWAT